MVTTTESHFRVSAFPFVSTFPDRTRHTCERILVQGYEHEEEAVMNNFSYSTSPGKLASLFELIQTTGVPDKVTQLYLESLGFKNKNDWTMVPVLKQLGFIDSSGKPTDRWQQYRDVQKAPAVLAQAIREAYADLFALYPDAHRKDAEALRNFFRSRTRLGEKAISYLVHTFQNLCKLADFDSTEAIPTVDLVPDRTPLIPSDARHDEHPTTFSAYPFTLNVNIQLVLPSQADSETYDLLFDALRRHILDHPN